MDLDDQESANELNARSRQLLCPLKPCPVGPNPFGILSVQDPNPVVLMVINLIYPRGVPASKIKPEVFLKV